MTMTYAYVRAKAMDSHDARKTMYRKDGGKVHDDAAEDRALIKKMVKPGDLKAKKGARVEGRARGGKADRPGKSKTVVNVVVPPGQNAAPPMPPPRPPMMAGPPPGAPPPHPMPPPGQPGMGPMAGPPPGGGMSPPGMMQRAKGGRAHRDMGGALPQPMQAGQPMMQTGTMRPPLPGQTATMKKGGRAERARGGGLDAGAASGEGRLEKADRGRKGGMIEYGD